MPRMTEITCKCGCKRKKMVRTADVKRGWGTFYSQSCKAQFQESKTGQYKKYMNGGVSGNKHRFEDSEIAHTVCPPSRKDCYFDTFTATWLEKDDDYENGYNPHPMSGEALGQWS